MSARITRWSSLYRAAGHLRPPPALPGTGPRALRNPLSGDWPGRIPGALQAGLRSMKQAARRGIGIAAKVSGLTALCALVALAGTWLLLSRMRVNVEQDQRALTTYLHQI